MTVVRQFVFWSVPVVLAVGTAGAGDGRAPGLLPAPAPSVNGPVLKLAPSRELPRASIPGQAVAPRRLAQSPTAPPPAPAAEAVPPAVAPEFDLQQVNAGLDIRPLRETSIDLRPTTTVPENPAGSVYAGSVNLRRASGWIAPVEGSHTAYVPFQPLYFEETNLERYGYHFGCLQPVISAAKFYSTLPALPYKLADLPPSTEQSNMQLPPAATAGPPVRCRLKRPNLKAAAVQAGVVAGAFLLIP